MKQEIQYNLLNLPSSINYQSGNVASYVYSASGAKLSVTYTNGVTTTTNQYCGNMLYEQIRETPDLNRAVQFENYIRKEEGRPLRTKYGRHPLPKEYQNEK